MADTSYGILLNSFFDGTTGMRLQALGTPGKDALLLAAFLTANECANMIGLYELSRNKLTRKLLAVKGKALTKAFSLLETERYAFYDLDTEFVWVREMARIRLGLVAGQPVANPRRLVAAQNLYQRSPVNPFLGPFYDRYHVELVLKHRRPPPFGERSPNQSPNHSVNRSPNVRQTFGEQASGTSTYRDQVPGDQVPGDQVPGDQVPGDQVPGEEEAAAAPRHTPPAINDAPDANVEVITTLVRKELLRLGLQEQDLIEATKALCAKYHIAYSSGVVRKAVDSALFRDRLPMAKAGIRGSA